MCQKCVYIFETCLQGSAINPKTWKNFGSRINSEYLLYPQENAQSDKMIKLEWHKIIIKKITREDFSDVLGHPESEKAKTFRIARFFTHKFPNKERKSRHFCFCDKSA